MRVWQKVDHWEPPEKTFGITNLMKDLKYLHPAEHAQFKETKN